MIRSCLYVLYSVPANASSLPSPLVALTPLFDVGFVIGDGHSFRFENRASADGSVRGCFGEGGRDATLFVAGEDGYT